MAGRVQGGYRAFTVKIGGTTVEVEPETLNIALQIGQRSMTSFDWHDFTGERVKDGTIVRIYDDTSTLIYSGFIDTDKRIRRNSQSYTLYHKATCKDNCYIADRRRVAASYLNVNAGYIVNDLYTTYLAGEGVTIGGVANGAFLGQSIVFNYAQTVSKVLDKLAMMSGYWWNIDQNKQLWFQPYTGKLAPWAYDGTMADLSSDDKAPQVQDGNPEYRNRQYVIGGVAETALQTENQYGDGKKQAFTLRYQVSAPRTASKFKVYVNGVQQTVGTKGQDSGFQWYAATGDQVVAQDPSGTPLAATDVLEVVYVGRFYSIALAESSAAISSRKSLEGGGTGYVEAAYRDAKLKNLPDAFSIAMAQLGHYGTDIQTFTFRTTKPGLAEGMMLTCTDAPLGLHNTQMLIQSVEIYEEDAVVWYDVTAIGSPADITWQSFFQSLANQADGVDASNLSDDTNLAQLLYVSENIEMAGTSGAGLTITTWTAPVCAPATICAPTLKVG